MQAQNGAEATITAPPTSRRIMVLYRTSLLAQGLETLLRQVEGLEVAGVDLDRDRAVIATVEAYRPEAVLWDRGDIPAAGADLVFEILEKLPSSRIFCFTSDENGLTVYAKRDISLATFSDLVRELQT